MSETEFREQAKQSEGIVCTFYPASRPLQRSIICTDQLVFIAGHHINPSRWTDGGSVPWFVRMFANPTGYLFRAFLLHDVLLFDGYGWEYANHALAKAMNELDAPLWQRIMVLEGVRLNTKWQYIKSYLGMEADYV